MTSKEIKTALKEARDFIKAKSFRDAIKKCQEVLKWDKENYMALVLLGAAYQDSSKEEAAKFLKRAVKASEDHLLALQGLVNCAAVDELPEIYGKLLKLQPERCAEFHNKILGFYKNLADKEALIAVLKEETKEAEERSSAAWKTLVQVLMDVDSESHVDLMEEALLKTISCVQVGYHADRYRKLLSILHRKGKLSDLLFHASNMSLMYTKDSFPLEWICKIYSEGGEVEGSLALGIDVYIEKLLELNSQSPVGLLAKVVFLLKQQDVLGARDILLRVYEIEPNWTRCQQLLFDIYHQLRAHSLAVSVFRKIKHKEPDLRVVKSLVHEEAYTEAMEAVKALLMKAESSKAQTEALMWLAKVLMGLDQKEAAKKTVEKLGDSGADPATLEVLRGLLGEPVDAELLFQLEDSDLLLDAGCLLLQQQDHETALKLFLKSAKALPWNSEAFFWLGKTYLELRDETRAVKCLEKCLHLNLQNEKAVHLLSSIYRKNENWESNLTLLQNTVRNASSKWGYYQLGLHFLATKAYNQAVDAFRSALRYDGSEAAIFEGLADAYFARGSYKSALKVYTKAVELNGNLYGKLQVANILRILQEYAESLEKFEGLLQEAPEYVPALKGAADTHHRLARQLYEEKRFGRAQIHFQAALESLGKLIRIRPSFGCVWRQFGNILEQIQALPPNFASVTVEGSFVGVAEESQRTQGEALLELASRCYSRAIKINPSDSYLYHDLAASYLARSELNEEQQERFRSLALAAAKYAIKMGPGLWENWNLLGFVAFKLDDLPLAQHAFIQVLNIDKKNPVAWTNLGLLYLSQDNIKLANKAFGKSQQSDMTYTNAWMGQAVIAEMVGELDEALDLYRHCTELQFTPESALGYANRVAALLNETKGVLGARHRYVIENMHALTVSLDQVSWCCKVQGPEKASAETLLFLGYFCMQKKLFKGAVEAYEAALEKVQGAQKDAVLCDLGYAYLKTSKPQEAIAAFRKITEASYKSTIGAALACFKAEEFAESYSIYSSALEWLAQSNVEKSLILITMAAMVYVFQGEADAKTVLFQCIGEENPVPQGLFSACAIGLLHSDAELAHLTVEELKKHDQDPVHGHHAVFLIAQFLIKQDQERAAIVYVCQKIHLFPDRPHLRQVLVSILSQQRRSKKFSLATSRLAQSIITLGTIDTENSSERLARCLAMASKAVVKIEPKRSHILAQRAIHLNPSCREAWSALVLATK